MASYSYWKGKYNDAKDKLNDYKDMKSELESIKKDIDNDFDSEISNINNYVDVCYDEMTTGLRECNTASNNAEKITEGSEKSTSSDGIISVARSNINDEINSLSTKISNQEGTVAYYKQKKREAWNDLFD